MKIIILFFFGFIVFSSSQLLITNNGPCACDLTSNLCDRDCCCDPNCTSLQIQNFRCPNDQISPASYGCFPTELLFQNNTGYLNVTIGDQYCVYQDNYTLRNFYMAPTILSATNISNIVPTGLMPLLINGFDAQNIFKSNNYLVGDTINTWVSKSSVGFLGLSRPDGTGLCTDGIPLGYLTNELVSCTRTITDLVNDCSNMPGTGHYYVLGMVVAAIPAAMITAQNNTSSGYFAPVNCNSCLQSSVPTYSASSSLCNNVVTNVKYEIFGESNITKVDISLSYGNVSANFVQQFNVTFIKAGYSTLGRRTSGNPGYIEGLPVKSVVNASSLQDMTIISGGDCGNGSPSTVLFGVNSYGDCKMNISGYGTNCAAINSFLNASLSPYLASSLTAYGNLSLDQLVPIRVNDDAAVSSSSSSCLVITKLTVYIVFARTGTLTLPQNKIIGYQSSFSYGNIANYNESYWLSVSVKFVDNSITLFDLSGATARLQAGNTVRDFLYLLYVDNGAAVTNSAAVTSLVTLLVSLIITLS